MSTKTIAKVLVDVPAKQTDRAFDYRVPEMLQDEVEIGSRVQVSFGNRKLIGYVIGFAEKSSAKRLKSIEEVLDHTAPLTSELVEIGLRMAQTYFCPAITALQAMVPTAFKGKYEKILRLHPAATQDLTSIDPSWAALRSRLEEKENINWEEAVELVGNRTILRKLIAQNLLILEELVGDRSTQQKETWVIPKDRDTLWQGWERISPRAAKQKVILQQFLEFPQEMRLSDLLRITQSNRTSVKRLEELGFLTLQEREKSRDPYANREFAQTEPLVLTPSQQIAFTSIQQSILTARGETVLLHGVTGSGKTEIYLQLIATILEKDQEAIVLVPEISLTPQMVDRFKGRFGNQVAVLHSRLSSGERYDEWRKIRNQQCRVVVGARSAIFAPFSNLGLIIIDEEHESSYQQEDSPRYHAREIATWRAEQTGATLLLGSATPSLESYVRAKKGEIHYIPLLERVEGRPLPSIKLIDMREELRSGNRSMFSKSLREALQSRLEKGEQSILFLNRRGYASFVLCRDCGERLTCPHCEVSLTFHQTNRTCRCHYCGYTIPIPSTCPSCESEQIRQFGTGTQRVEEELVKRFPGIRIVRMDIDTTSRKGSHERLLTEFRERRADVLLGTQMIAKGLDFPDVTLVGVITADQMLYLPDYQASEHAFQLLTQVSGRAGRHTQPGEVLIQTYTPDHPSVEMAANHQIEEFYHKEATSRKRHFYPPFCGMFTMMLSHPDQFALMQISQQIGTFLHQEIPRGMAQILGPVPAMIPKIKDRYRIQIVLKHPLSRDVYQVIQQVLYESTKRFHQDPDFRFQIRKEGSTSGREI
ncbi:primosomal protein N' [Risungbinella massiliensis]|uniref:primosomal protein N' n=1 Tax=Risungbinella massiliensis TaxID=1329796 RepID=UPI0005CBF521|nr:primosomal protein N' [Risungbinella massiliensis]